jgi:hypothetical protein
MLTILYSEMGIQNFSINMLFVTNTIIICMTKAEALQFLFNIL